MAKLAAYVAKRDFKKTPEPEGRAAAKTSGFSFVIQKHAATRLHYDLRLELDGVMLSWAVTKGPSLLPGEKRLAVHVEDHPIEYNTFEGMIPKGQYGGGTVLIWDRGRWQPEGDPRKGMAKGHLDFSLDGEKLHGRYHLVRLKPRPGERQEPWLLIKSDDEHARGAGDPDILEELPLSVASGRSLDEIAADPGGAVWQSNREPEPEARQKTRAGSRARKAEVSDSAADAGVSGSAEPARRKPARGKSTVARAVDDPSANAKGRSEPPPKADPNGRPSPDRASLPKGGQKAAMPSEIAPCLATLASQAPSRGPWLHEVKWDGYRLIVFVRRSKARVATRRGLDWTPRFPAIAEAASALAVESAIIDGEAVVEDEHGRASFSALQNALSDEHGKIARDAVLYCFDLLYLDGHDLRALPLEDRKARLGALVPAGDAGALRLSEHLDGDGAAMLRSACELGLEGIISKRRDRPYRSGRSPDWLKIKCSDRQEFVIGGYAPSNAGPRTVGSLILGYYQDGKLRHAGRAGTGYTAESARAVWRLLDPLARTTSPFAGKLTAEERRGAVWVEPKLVAEIEFRGWTGDDRLRHAAFKGMREDKVAGEVVRETSRGLPSPGRDDPPPAPTPRRTVVSSKAGGIVAGVALTHPERVLWQEGITKRDLALFYESIAEWLLPQVAGRPLSLVRCPSGAEAGCFFQKHSWAGLGDDIRRATVREENGDEEEVLFVENIRGVVSLVQASVLEIHPWGSAVADLDRPDRIVMDLDPGPGVAWADVIAAAFDIRERLRGVKLESVVKTTGGKGLHVVVPLKPRAGWAEVKSFAQALALAMEADAPDRYVAKASKQARRGLIYVDYLRNGRGATAVAAYSTRARPAAPVAVPVDWSELTAKLRPDGFTLRNLGTRLADLRRDPWHDLAELARPLPGGVSERTGRVRNRRT